MLVARVCTRHRQDLQIPVRCPIKVRVNPSETTGHHIHEISRRVPQELHHEADHSLPSFLYRYSRIIVTPYVGFDDRRLPPSPINENANGPEQQGLHEHLPGTQHRHEDKYPLNHRSF